MHRRDMITIMNLRYAVSFVIKNFQLNDGKIERFLPMIHPPFKQFLQKDWIDVMFLSTNFPFQSIEEYQRLFSDLMKNCLVVESFRAFSKNPGRNNETDCNQSHNASRQ